VRNLPARLGVDDLAQVRKAYLESDGGISVLKRAPRGSSRSTMPPSEKS
jgi:uncharacterized membrane protein YcaP (DUF421 family)